MIDIVCLKWGDKFGAEYVNNLFSGIERNSTVPFKFHCFTDDTTDVLENINCIDLPNNNLSGWWNKLWLFSDELPFETGTRILFMDLDTLITDNIDMILEFNCPHNIVCLSNWYDHSGINSAFMMWRHGTQTHIWERFVADPDSVINNNKGDQDWINQNLTEHDRWQNQFPYEFVSYKQSCIKGLPNGAKVVCYHGTPSVIQSFTETVENWDSKYRNGGVPYYPQSWVKDHWRLNG